MCSFKALYKPTHAAAYRILYMETRSCNRPPCNKPILIYIYTYINIYIIYIYIYTNVCECVYMYMPVFPYIRNSLIGSHIYSFYIINETYTHVYVYI